MSLLPKPVDECLTGPWVVHRSEHFTTRKASISQYVKISESAALPRGKKMYFRSTACLLCLLTIGASCQAPQSGQSWTIGNTRIERTMSFTIEAGLRTSRLTNLDTHTDLIASTDSPQNYAPEFSVTCNGKGFNGRGKSFELLSGAINVIPNGKQLVIKLRARAIPLDVDVTYSVYDGQPAVRKALVLRNTGSAVIRLTHLKTESISPSIGPSADTLLNAQYGTVPREILYTGRSEDVGLQIFNGRTGDGFALLNEAPGYMKRTEIDGFYHPGHVFLNVMYDTDLMPFERDLKPGEEFHTAASSMVLFRLGDRRFDPQWVIPSYTAAVFQKKIAPHGPPWIYNTWNPFRRTINEKITHDLIDIAGDMGIGIFTIDDGWQKDYGANAPNLTTFPHGIEPIRDAVEAKGMRLGLWLPLATISKNAQAYKDHPEWVALDHAGVEKETDTAAGNEIVMCLACGYQDIAAARINEAIGRFHLAYVKLDLTTVFNAYGESPGCWPKDHSYNGWAESLGLIYEAVRNVTTKVYAEHPDVLIDLSFEMWGQKHLIDAGLLNDGDMDWLSNVNDEDNASAGPRQARMLLYQRAAAMPADTMLIGNLQANLPNITEVFATEVGAAPLLLGDLRKLSASDRTWYRDHILWYKRLRSEVNLSESFFPLGAWRQPSPVAWDGFARLAHTGAGIVTVFRNESGLPSVSVKLPLMPEGTFRLKSAITNRDLGVFSTNDWKQGVTLNFQTGQLVEIVEVRAVETGSRPIIR